MSAARVSFWRLLPGVRRRERGRFLYFAALAALLNMALTVGLVGAEALFLSRVGIELLPHTFVIAALTTVLGTLVYAVWVGRARNDSYFIVILLIAVGLIVFGTLGAWLRWTWILPALFCLYFLSQAVFINHFWTFTWDYFDTAASKRLFPLLAIGQSVGGFLGGALVMGMGRFAPPEALLVTWALLLTAAVLVLRLGHRQLRRWGPLALEEADETSLEGMQGALRYIRGSSLGRWLALSTLGMVLTLFVAQYLYSDIFVRSFPRAEELAYFLGLFLAITNLIEIPLTAFGTPRLIERFGVAGANLAHPVLTLLSFAALALDYRLGAALVARVNRELIEQAVAAPVRNLAYSALPFRSRGRLRAFLEGVVGYSGMALAGVLLLVLGGRVAPLWLCLAGAGTALLYLLANLTVRRQYLRTLAEGLREGRIDLAELSGDIGNWEASRLAQLWNTLLASDADAPSAAQLDLAPVLARRGIVEPLLRAAIHPSRRVRRACIQALALAPAEEAKGALVGALQDPEASVRLAALQTLADLELTQDTELKPAVRERLEESDVNVRAEAALHCGPAGLRALEGMARSGEREPAVAALRRLPPELLPLALERVGDTEPAVRAEALERVARLGGAASVSRTRLTAALGHAEVAVRRAAVRMLGQTSDPAALADLARALADPAREVRTLASALLGEAGDVGVDAVLPVLETTLTPTLEVALSALAAAGTPRARRLLARELRRHVHDVWRALLVLHTLLERADPSVRFLRLAYQNVVSRSMRAAVLILELSEDARLVRMVTRVLRFASARKRGDALEVLSNLGDREVARLLVLLLEAHPFEEKIPLVADLFRAPANHDEVLEAARVSSDPWIRRAYAACAAERRHGRNEEEGMERLLYLQRVPLFSQLTLEQLEAIDRILSEARYLKGEVICQEGEIGNELYVLIAGEVGVFKGYGTEQAVCLTTQAPVTCFGEMAVLCDEPRSATVVANEDARLLTLDGGRVKELIYQMPEISFDFFRVLTMRLNEANQRYQDLVGSRPPTAHPV